MNHKLLFIAMIIIKLQGMGNKCPAPEIHYKNNDDKKINNKKGET